MFISGKTKNLYGDELIEKINQLIKVRVDIAICHSPSFIIIPITFTHTRVSRKILQDACEDWEGIDEW